jgi:thiamine-monophosphate kinase
VKNWEELNLIKSIRSLVSKNGHNVLLGIGDDTAVVNTPAHEKLLYTVDSVVDGIHFLGDLNLWESAGKRAIGAATSDIAAMGGTPLYAMLSLFLPQDFPVRHVNAFLKGFLKRLKEYGMPLIGGNIATMSGKFAADTVVIGKAYGGKFVSRSGARNGDIVCMSGITGEAMAGLDLLTSGKTKRYPGLIKKYLEPVPMLRESIRIVREMSPHAMIDVSDGLLQDTLHIAEESKVGVVLDLDSIPVSEGVRYAARLMGKSTYDYVLTGGDDYVLVFTVPAQRYKAVMKGVKIHTIGRVIQGKGIRFYKDGKRADLKLKKLGYTHT